MNEKLEEQAAKALKQIVWGYAESEHTERWFGACATREEAIQEAKNEYGEVFWIVEGTKPSPKEFVPSVGFILEHMAEKAGDLAGEASEDYLDVSDEGETVLAFLLEAWAEKYAPVAFWVVSGKPEFIDLRG